MTGKADLPPVDDELLAALEFRYAEEPVCRVCGASLGLVNTKDMKYACLSDAASLSGRHGAAGATWQEALHHYDRSVMYRPPEGDRRVLALVAEVRRLREVLSTDTAFLDKIIP